LGSKQVRVLLVDLLDAGRIGHALRQLCHDTCHRISRHQARQEEIQYDGENKGDQEPKQLVKEIPSVSFQRSTSSKIKQALSITDINRFPFALS
jgi:hypothetical protein